MRRFFDSLGWILFLLLAAAALVFYNVAYRPQADRISRLKTEISMWTAQVQSLTDSIDRSNPAADTAFRATLLYDVLFAAADSFRVCQSGEQALRGHVPELRGTNGEVFVIGHTDNTPVPERLRARCPTNWEFAAAKAAGVASALIGWGVPASRIRVVSAADTRPVADNATATARAANRRVQLVVLR
jgi:outer membrane protein OmpA-like peptidoglycan-associated protein